MPKLDEPTRREVWRLETEMLRSLLEVCRQNGLHCFADGGTLLGAVRHQGFIPWDDDIDVVMFREDYDKLLEIGKTAFHTPIFFQTYETDACYIRPHIQLRYVETTAILPWEKGIVKFDQGIFIDIFPLDGVPTNKFKRYFQWLKIQALKKLIIAVCYQSQIKNVFKKMIVSLISKEGTYPLQRMLNTQCRKYADSGLVTLVCLNETSDRNLLCRSWYDQTVNLLFEGLFIPAPEKFKQVLQVKYGDDYMVPKQEGTMHGEVLFDPYKSYKEYI